METTIDRFGRVLIPKKVRDDLGLRPGTALKVEELGRAVRLSPLTEETVLADEGGILVFTGRIGGDVGATLVDVREDRLDTLMGGSPR
ncbi:MAG: AbrB/MazE/SpoVT family DNA-binding domain-containing protein [Deltaproteobacteria bacterium]|nr:AbrB/MazE/SpoVT family DNA-binding domain-containing protein [Deltaproteobacteria bacterium]